MMLCIIYYLLLLFLSIFSFKSWAFAKTLTFLNHMMLGVMAKKSKREGENGRYAYRQREYVFLTPEIKKKKKKRKALYSHLRNAEQLFTSWGFTKKTQESHLVS